MFRSCPALLLAVLLFTSYAPAQEVPVVTDEPRIDKTMDNEMFDFVSKLLGSNKMAPHMKCGLKVRNSRELRKFSSGEEWIEILEVDFKSNSFDSSYKMKFKIPSNAKYGSKRANNQWSGTGEDIKIDLADYYGHWIRFTHDGQGRLVQLMLGNNLRMAPCEIK